MAQQHIRVLIVDDDAVDRIACRRALAQNQDFRFELFEAETGRQGLQLALAENPDCILLDYRLPDLDGLEFLAELRDEMGKIPVPVMMLTGSDNALVAVEAMKRGARDYLVKDVERQYLELLPTIIERVLREQHLLEEKREAEIRLCQAEAKYRTLVEQMPAITYIEALDEAGAMSYISPQVKLLGFSPEEWLATPELHFKLVHPDDLARVREEFARSRASGKGLRCEYRLLARNGRVFWFRNEAGVVRDDAGRPLFLQGTLIDITEAKQIEEELRQHRYHLEDLVEKRTAMLEAANEHLRQEISERRQVERDLFEEKELAHVALASIGDAVITTDAAGRIEYLNPVAEQLTGWSNSEAAGQPLQQVFNVVSEATRQPAENLAARCLREGRGSGLANHSILIRRDGAEFCIDDSAEPIHSRDGKTVGIVIVFHDVTQQLSRGTSD